MRLTSRVVPARLETTACCFLPRVLNKLDLPTLGRPTRAILSVVSSLWREDDLGAWGSNRSRLARSESNP